MKFMHDVISVGVRGICLPYMCMELRRQFEGLRSLLLRGFWKSNSSHLAQRQAPLYTEPSPRLSHFFSFPEASYRSDFFQLLMHVGAFLKNEIAQTHSSPPSFTVLSHPGSSVVWKALT